MFFFSFAVISTSFSLFISTPPPPLNSIFLSAILSSLCFFLFAFLIQQALILLLLLLLLIIIAIIIILLSNFSHQGQLIVFLWSLHYSKSPLVSRTLLSIVSNAAVWMISICSQIFKSSRPFSSIWTPFQVRQLQLVSPSTSCSTAFLVLQQGQSICSFFRFLLFSFCGWLEQQNLIYKFSFFFPFFFLYLILFNLILFYFLLFNTTSGLLTEVR